MEDNLQLTPAAQMLFALAESESRYFRHGDLGTEHLLAGMVLLNDHPVTQLLQQHGINYPLVSKQLERLRWFGSSLAAVELPHTDALRRVLANLPQQQPIGVKTILEAILEHDDDGGAITILTQVKCDLQQLRADLAQLDDAGDDMPGLSAEAPFAAGPPPPPSTGQGTRAGADELFAALEAVQHLQQLPDHLAVLSKLAAEGLRLRQAIEHHRLAYLSQQRQPSEAELELWRTCGLVEGDRHA